MEPCPACGKIPGTEPDTCPRCCSLEALITTRVATPATRVFGITIHPAVIETLRLFGLSILTFIIAPIVVIPLIFLWIALWQFFKPLALIPVGLFLVLCYRGARRANARERSVLDAIPAEAIEKLRQTAGRDGERLLSYASPLLRSRLLTAGAYQSGALFLHDPIDDNPALSDIMAQVDQDIETKLQGLHRRRGSCHRYWGEKQRILFERHGII